MVETTTETTLWDHLGMLRPYILQHWIVQVVKVDLIPNIHPQTYLRFVVLKFPVHKQKHDNFVMIIQMLHLWNIDIRNCQVNWKDIYIYIQTRS